MKKEVDKYIGEAKDIIVTAHTHPDGDALSSVLGMLYYIKKYYPKKEVNVCLESEPATSFSFMHLYDEIGWIKDITPKLKEADLVIFMDGNQPSRFSFQEYKLSELKGKAICIDHHASENNVDYDYAHIDSSKPSNAQIIVEELLTDDDLSDGKVAEMLLVGILTDTGGFKYVGKEQASLFDTVKRIVSKGDLYVSKIKDKLDQLSKKEVQIIGILTNNMTFLETKNKEGYCYSYLTDDDLKKIDLSIMSLQKAYHKYMSDYLRKVEGHPWGFVILPRENGTFKISFRSSKGGVVVREIAETLGGGGHDGAAAAEIDRGEYPEIEGAIDYVNELINTMKLTPFS